MSLLDWRFIKPLLTFVPTNAAVIVGDSLTTALEKLQGQINALPTSPAATGPAKAVLTTTFSTTGTRETVAIQLLVPAGGLVVGSTYAIKLYGQFTVTTYYSTNNYIRLRIGGKGTKSDPLIVVTSPQIGFANLANAGFTLDFQFTVQTVGTAGTVMAVSKMANSSSSDILTPDAIVPATVPINTTIANYISCTAQCGSNSSNISFYFGAIEQLK